MNAKFRVAQRARINSESYRGVTGNFGIITKVLRTLSGGWGYELVVPVDYGDLIHALYYSENELEEI